MTPELAARPAGVPADATWDAERQVWHQGSCDATSARDGLQRFFRADGSLLREVQYAAGKLHGPFVEYHPNGEIAREGEYREGTAHGVFTAYASTAPTPERLRACCVPPGAWKLVSAPTRFGAEDVFYDREGRRLLADGSVHPDIPAGLPLDARYVAEPQGWEQGEVGSSGRTGCWRFWTFEGELKESANYRAGKLEGQRQWWSQGELRAAWHYANGELHGTGFELVEPGRFVDEQIRSCTGEYRNGVSCGSWCYLDRAGRALYVTDLGDVTSDAEQVPSALARAGANHEALQPIAEEFAAGGARAAAYLFELVAARKDAAALSAATSGLPRFLPAVTAARLRALRAQRLDLPEFTVRCLELLMRGAAPESVLPSLATKLALREPEAAILLSETALTLAPDGVEALTVLALARIEAGQTAAARTVLGRLRELDNPATDLELMLRVTYPQFTFDPARFQADALQSDQLPEQVDQPLEALRGVISKAAQRLERIRSALLALGASTEWLPPDVAGLCLPETGLEQYSFEAFDPSAPDAGDTVQVDERLELTGLSRTELLWAARVEWVTLCWACYSCGLSEVALPAELVPPQNFGQTLATVFSRHLRAQDQIQTSGIRARSQKWRNFEWEGEDISRVPVTLARQCYAEYGAIRAVLFFAGDGTCRSPWQDDLRGLVG